MSCPDFEKPPDSSSLVTRGISLGMPAVFFMLKSKLPVFGSRATKNGFPSLSIGFAAKMVASPLFDDSSAMLSSKSIRSLVMSSCALVSAKQLSVRRNAFMMWNFVLKFSGMRQREKVE